MFAPQAMGIRRLALELLARRIQLGSGNGKRARRFEDGAGVLEHILDRGAHRIGVHQNDFIDVFLADAEGLFADQLDRRAVGEQADGR